jgi:hypothetical protein
MRIEATKDLEVLTGITAKKCSNERSICLDFIVLTVARSTHAKKSWLQYRTTIVLQLFSLLQPYRAQ